MKPCARCKINPRHVTKSGKINSWCAICESQRQKMRTRGKRYKSKHDSSGSWDKASRLLLIEYRHKLAVERLKLKENR